MITHLDVTLTNEECYVIKEAFEKADMTKEERTHELGGRLYPAGRESFDIALSILECGMIAEAMQKSGLDADPRTASIAEKIIVAIMIGKRNGQAS